MKIGIVGYGTVGTHLQQQFESVADEIVVYDKYREGFASMAAKKKVNDMDLVFVAVPTPEGPDGSCDTCAVEDAADWLKPPICIKSTIPPGTTDRLVATYKKAIVFSPEYVGETSFHPSKTSRIPDVVAIGGDQHTGREFMALHRRALGPTPAYFITDALTAELAKYMENSFLATKVAFVAQFFVLAEAYGVDFDQLREIWVSDSRIGRSHSTVTGLPGFGGKCLPKDLAAIVWQGKHQGINVSLLEAVLQFNNDVRQPFLNSRSAQNIGEN